MKRLILPIAVLALLLGAVPAGSAPRAEGMPVVSTAAAKYYGYATALVTVQKGAEITYYNFDIEKHNVVQDTDADGASSKKKMPWCRDFPKGHCPIFWSELIGLGETPVLGLENVEVGKVYSFLCTLHPGMKGRLVAVP